MLTATSALISYLQIDKNDREVTIINAYLNAILNLGNKEDAELLLAQYLSDPFDFHHSYLLPIIEYFGDCNFAEAIYNKCFVNVELAEDADPELLQLLGKLHFSPIKPTLIKYAFSDKGYDVCKYAVLGLLHFDCAGIQNLILTEIEKTYNKNLFSEFVPALVCKLNDNAEVLEKLFYYGKTVCSTDCNAGIILGFSLCGTEGEKYFRKALFDRDWELDSSSTGSVYYTYEGLQNLNITFSELYEQIKSIADKDELEYSLQVFFALLDIKLRDNFSFKTSAETFQHIYLALYKWKNENKANNIIGLAQSVEMEDEAYRLERLLEQRINEEILLETLRT